jgi:hypothetical protein
MSNVSDFVILVNVIFDSSGKPQGSAKLLLDNKPYPVTPLPVGFGDRVSWLVHVSTPNRNTLPYDVGFSDPSFFDASSLHVSAGGLSPSLTVKRLKGRTKFTVTVTGIGIVIDPEMQTGNDLVLTDFETIFTTAAAYTIYWDIDTNTMDLLPDITAGDKVTFIAKSTMIAPTIVIEFPPAKNDTVWASPFDDTKAVYAPLLGADPATVGPLPVQDNVDKGSTFTFFARTADSTHQSIDQNVKMK